MNTVPSLLCVDGYFTSFHFYCIFASLAKPSGNLIAARENGVFGFLLVIN